MVPFNIPTIDLIPQDESVSFVKLIIGIAPPTLASYLNSTLFFSASDTTSLNFKAKCPLFDVTTSFPALNAFKVKDSAGSASVILVGVASIKQSYSTASNTSKPEMVLPYSG